MRTDLRTLMPGITLCMQKSPIKDMWLESYISVLTTDKHYINKHLKVVN